MEVNPITDDLDKEHFRVVAASYLEALISNLNGSFPHTHSLGLSRNVMDATPLANLLELGELTKLWQEPVCLCQMFSNHPCCCIASQNVVFPPLHTHSSEIECRHSYEYTTK